MNFPAVTQTVVSIIALGRARQFPCFLLSLIVWLPVLYNPAVSYHSPHWPHILWQNEVWLPAVVWLIAFQALAALEAFFAFGGCYEMAPTASVGLGAFSVAAMLVFWEWPHGNMVQQAVQVARYQRVGCWIFLTLTVALYSCVRTRELFHRAEGRHLICLGLLSWTWAMPSIWALPSSWIAWIAMDSLIGWIRAGLLVIWILLVPLSREFFPLPPARAYRDRRS